jgi:hypothetical protein
LLTKQRRRHISLALGASVSRAEPLCCRSRGLAIAIAIA